MGKGRAPCCDKSKVKKGPWSADEDLKLCAFIRKYGHSNWRALPKQAGLLRCGKSCRLRWINYLSPDVKRGNFTPVEEQTIINIHSSIGNKWSKIASYLPGRTDNEIKNVWNTHLKKRLTKAGDPKMSYSANSPSIASSSITSSGDQKQESNEVSADEGVQESEAKDPKEKPGLLLKEISVSGPSNNDHHVTKEFSASDSPMSSHASNFSNPIFQDNMPSKGMEFFVSNHVSNINPGPGNCVADVNVEHEIALDSDPDFWELLDSLDPLQVCNSEQNGENQGPFHLPSHGEKFDSEMEWLRYLEKELGLTGDIDNQPKDQEIMSLEPEISPGLDSFPIWPSSPHNLGI